MPLSAFADKASPPDAAAVAAVVGRTHPLWDHLVTTVSDTYAPVSAEWNFSGKAYGWSLRLKTGKRAVVYMTPGRGYFLASFALGEKACATAAGAGLPAAILQLIDEAPRYAEGRGVRVPVRSRKDLDAVIQIVSIKMTPSLPPSPVRAGRRRRTV